MKSSAVACSMANVPSAALMLSAPRQFAGGHNGNVFRGFAGKSHVKDGKQKSDRATAETVTLSQLSHFVRVRVANFVVEPALAERLT